MNFNGRNIVSWYFNGPELNSDKINHEEWNCYNDCKLIVKGDTNVDKFSGAQELFTAQMPTKYNNCDSWYEIPKEHLSKMNNIRSICVKVSCGDRKKSDVYCWQKK